MSENKTKPTTASVADFIRSSDPKKIEGSFELVEIMERLSGEKAIMWGPSIIGFGTYHYKYKSGREGDMPRIGFSPRKSSYSLYVHHHDSSRQLKIIEKLGKVKLSKGCIYVNKLLDIDLAVLEELIAESLKESERRYGT